MEAWSFSHWATNSNENHSTSAVGETKSGRGESWLCRGSGDEGDFYMGESTETQAYQDVSRYYHNINHNCPSSFHIFSLIWIFECWGFLRTPSSTLKWKKPLSLRSCSTSSVFSTVQTAVLSCPYVTRRRHKPCSWQNLAGGRGSIFNRNHDPIRF